MNRLNLGGEGGGLYLQLAVPAVIVWVEGEGGGGGCFNRLSVYFRGWGLGICELQYRLCASGYSKVANPFHVCPRVLCSTIVVQHVCA